MKKILCLMLAAIMLFTAGCANKPPVDDIGGQAGPTATLEAEIVTEASTTAETTIEAATTEATSTEATTTEAVTTTEEVTAEASTVETTIEATTTSETTTEATTDAITTTTEATSTEATTAEKEKEPPKPVSPTAWEVAEGMNLGNNLGNTFEGHYTDGTVNFEWAYVIGQNKPEDYEASWGGGHPTKLTVQGMKDCGFDTIRIPVYWGNMMKNDGTWTVHPDYLARVREIIDYATEADMYAVVNIHHFDEFIIRRYDVEECYDIFYRIWYQIADAYKDCPYTVVFEGFNEALGGGRLNEKGELIDRSRSEAYELTNRCNQAFVDAVRATGGNNAYRVLIASGYYTNIDNTTSSQFKMPTDTVKDRLMVSVHYVDNNMYWSNQIGSREWVSYIDDQCDKLDKAFIDKGIPVFLGETTAGYPDERMSSSAIYKTSPECLEYVLTELNNRGYVAVLWTTGSDYYNRDTGKMADKAHGEIVAKIAKQLR